MTSSNPSWLTRRPMGRIAAVALAAAALASPLRAQSVVGHVVEEGSGRPLIGAFLQLQTPTGERVGGVLSGDAGAFILRAPGPGSYRVIAELIGYAGTESDLVELASGAGVRMTLQVPVQAVSLEGITADVGERCRRRPGSGPAMASLWEEARKALRVTRWAQQQNVLRFQVVEHVRELDASSLEVLSHEESGHAGFYDRSPYASVPAHRLDEQGYVRQSPDETWDYFAPDADVLLSESFLNTHCFRVVPASTDEPGLIGLGFEPVPERRLPDIEGVLWLDEGTAELRRLDFRYVALPFRHGHWPQVGGRVEFERLATGMWIVRRWRIRMPLRATEIRGQGPPTLELLSLLQQGAEVRSVRTRGGTRLAEASGATLYGVVTGPDGRALSDARIEVTAVGVDTRAGPEGGYRITGLPAGNWAVRLHHPLLDLTGLGVEERTVGLEAGQAARLPFRVLLDGARAMELCTAAGWDADRGPPVLLYGEVRAFEGRLPVSGGLVRLQVGGTERRIIADSTGAYRVCLPATGTARVAAVAPREAMAPLAGLHPASVPLDAPGFVRRDLTLAGPATAVVPGPEPVRGVLIGQTVNGATLTAVGDATVMLQDTAGHVVASQVSDTEGRFRMPHPGLGDRFTLAVEHVAFPASRGEIRFPPEERVRLEVLLNRRANGQEPIVVKERRQGLLVEVGFYDRAERADGVFMDRAEIERRNPGRITDLFRGRSGLRVIELPSGGSDVRVLQQVTFRYEPGRCQPAVWIDGGLAREGGLVRGHGAGEPIPAAPLSSLIQPEDVEGLEVLTGRTGLPPRFATANATCGVLLIWTRPEHRD